MEIVPYRLFFLINPPPANSVGVIFQLEAGFRQPANTFSGRWKGSYIAKCVFNINLLGMQLFQKLRAPFLGFEAHENEVIGHKDGTFHQHAVGGKQCKHFRILHG